MRGGSGAPAAIHRVFARWLPVRQAQGRLRTTAHNLLQITYFGRMLRLTSLAPDIVEAVLRGAEPDGLSLRVLQRDLPNHWDEQRKRWRCWT